jgi:hypothetical protein
MVMNWQSFGGTGACLPCGVGVFACVSPIFLSFAFSG